MPSLETRHFGVIAYQAEELIEFPGGLPGFEQQRSFVAIEQPETRPLVFLQSVAEPALCFLALPVLAIDPSYRLSIPSEDLRILGLPGERQPAIGAEVLCLAIVSVAEGRSPTANLLAPIVVNLESRRAVQAIQTESGYSHQTPLIEETPC